MAVIFGSARIDERGRVSGGKAGDQTGREVATEPFYVHKLGWVVLRAKDPIIAQRIATAMLRACNNNNIGYDQNQRTGVITHGTNSSVLTEADCSALVRQCVKEASGIDAGNFNTENEKAKLLATGLFVEIKFTNANALMVGDILITKTKGHTGVIVQANQSQTPVDNSGVDVFYRVYANGRWYDTVKNTEDYAGIENKAISAIMAKVSRGGIAVNVAPIGKGYLGWATGFNETDYNNGYAGTKGKDIDRVQMKLINLSGYHVQYRVSVIGSIGFLPWVTDLSDYAGIKGKKIDKVQIRIVK